MSNEETPAAVGARLEPGVGRLVPERADSDAPICPWCDRQGWNNCESYEDTYTCDVRLL